MNNYAQHYKADDNSDDDIYDDSYVESYSFQDAKLFQRYLITLIMFTLGGQRRQIVSWISSKVSNVNLFQTYYQTLVWHPELNQYKLMLPVEKITRLALADGIPVPVYVGKLLEYFWETVRPALKPKKHVICFWVNEIGNAMGKFEISQH